MEEHREKPQGGANVALRKCGPTDAMDCFKKIYFQEREWGLIICGIMSAIKKSTHYITQITFSNVIRLKTLPRAHVFQHLIQFRFDHVSLWSSKRLNVYLRSVDW